MIDHEYQKLKFDFDFFHLQLLRLYKHDVNEMVMNQDVESKHMN